MAVTTKKLFPATSNATTTVFNNVGIQLNNQDDLDVYVTLSGGTRVLQLRQSTGSTATSSHPQVNNTDGLYFPAVTAGTTLYNYTLSTDNNTITFNSALPQGAVVFCERRTRDADSSYTSFATGSTIRATDLNNSSTESNFTAQDGRNKALEIEGAIWDGDQISSVYVTSANIVDGTIVEDDLANSAVTQNKLANNSVGTPEIINGAVTRVKLEADIIDGTKLADNAVDSEHYTDGSIDRVHLEADIIDSTKLADNAVNSEHYVDGSIDRVHLAADIVDGTKIADDSIDSEHIAAGALDNEHYAAGSITADKLNGATVVTNSEQSGYSVNDTSFFTTSAAEARYFNASTGETIKDGDTFPDNDTTIATTAAINDRIIDLVDDVGGFVPIANELSFPNSNPDVNNGAGTLISIQALSQNLTSNGAGEIAINNGTVGNSVVYLVGAPANTTFASGFGLIVETKDNTGGVANTYTFHRLVPKATEVTTVAGKATEIGRLGTADAVADMAILGTADVVADMNTLATADIVSDMNTLAVADVISDMNTLAVTSVVNNMDTVATNVANVNTTAGSISNVNTTAGSIANVNTVAGSIANVNTTAGSISNVNTTAGSIANVNSVASNMANVNNFADRYQIAANNPSTDGGGNALAAGDLYFNTSANELKVYNGSSWQGGVTASGSFASTTGNTFTGDNRYNDNVKALFGTGSDLEIFHQSNNSYINDTSSGYLYIQGNDIVVRSTGQENMIVGTANGAVDLYYDNSKKLETTANGATVSGSIVVNGNVNATGALNADGNVTISNTSPQLFLTDTNHADFSILVNNDSFTVVDETNSADRLKIDSTGNVQIPADDKKLQIGASQDLEIYHSSSNYIDSKTGHLYLRAGNGNMYLNAVNNETGIEILANDRVGLFYNNSKKLDTTSAGIDITGTTTDDGARHDGDVTFIGGTSGRNVVWDMSDNALEFDDNAKAIFGTGTDLLIYHDGLNSVIRSGGTGQLQIESSNNTNIVMGNAALSETIFKGIVNGAVELYHDNNKKFETTSAGVSVTGDIELGDNDELKLGASGDLKFEHQSSSGDSLITEVGGGNLIIQGSNIIIRDAGTVEKYIEMTQNGSVDLYHNGSKKLETTSGGIDITGGVNATALSTFSASGSAVRLSDGSIQRYGNADADYFQYYDGSGDIAYLSVGASRFLRLNCNDINFYDAGNSELLFRVMKDSETQLYFDASVKLQTKSYGVDITGDLVIDALPDTTTNSYLKIAIQDTDGTLKSDDSIKINPAQNSMSVDGLFIASNTVRPSGNGPLTITTANASGTVDFIVRHTHVECNGDLLPATDSTDDLGADATRWANVYADTYYGDGSNLSGVAAFPSGTTMLFRQNSAPTGWTKSTTHDNKALRVVSGNCGSGGSTAFTTALNSSFATSGGSVSNHTLTTAQMPSHNHGMQQKSIGAGCGGDASNTGAVGTFGCNNNSTGISTFNTGSGNSHNHGFTNPSLNLNVAYIDVIVASKD